MRRTLAIGAMLSLLVVPSVASGENSRRADCTIRGTSGADDLRGTDARDVICGLGGDDEIRGRDGNDLLLGGPGDDDIGGDRDNDLIKGGTGSDNLSPGSGADRMKGGDGPEFCLWGGDGHGDDVVDGGAGRDRYTADPGDRVISAEEQTGACPPRV